jgi:hypothetical protein
VGAGRLLREFRDGIEIPVGWRPALRSLEEGHLFARHGIEPRQKGLPLITIPPEPSDHAQEDLAGDVLSSGRRTEAQQNVAVDGIEMGAIERFDGGLLAAAGSLHEASLTTLLALVDLGIGRTR